MTEGVVAVRGLARHFKAYHCNDRRPHIRKVVKSVRYNRDTGGYKPYGNFKRAQEKIAYYSDRAAQSPVFKPYRAVIYIFAVFYKYFY